MLRWIKRLFKKNYGIKAGHYDKEMLRAFKDKAIFGEFAEVKSMPKSKGSLVFRFNRQQGD